MGTAVGGAIITDGAAAADIITAGAITVASIDTDRRISPGDAFVDPLPRRKHTPAIWMAAPEKRGQFSVR
jgi:hypothetical protein